MVRHKDLRFARCGLINWSRSRREAHRHAEAFKACRTRCADPTEYNVVSTLLNMLRLAALKYLSPNATPPVPWQRVVSSNGTISSRGPGTDGAQRQRDALEAEGVEVVVGRSGEMRVDFRAYGWFPDVGTIDAGNADTQVEQPEEAEDVADDGDVDEDSGQDA